jgi:hypothetical protein
MFMSLQRFTWLQITAPCSVDECGEKNGWRRVKHGKKLGKMGIFVTKVPSGREDCAGACFGAGEAALRPRKGAKTLKKGETAASFLMHGISLRLLTPTQGYRVPREAFH